MRKWILSFCCLALATPAWAQSTTIIHDASFQPVNHVARGGACCNDACPQKSCVAVPTMIKHSKTVFASKCIEYCTPKCSLQRGCDSCTDNCGPVRTKHVLMKKVITHECPGTKCEVAYVAAPCTVKCANPCPTTCTNPCATPTSRLRGFLCDRHCTPSCTPDCAPTTRTETLPVAPKKQ